MEDDRIGNLLRDLPREHARPGFTARVLERLDGGPEDVPRWTFRFTLATAAAALAAVAVSAVVLTGSRESMEAARAKQALEALRAEHGRLEQELQEMSQPPVVYLGGDENVDLVLDLGKVRETDFVAPASYREDTF